MARAKVAANAKDWVDSGKTMEQRIKEAEENGNMAKKLFNVKGIMPRIIEAIDNENQVEFDKACKDAGITDSDMRQRMWDATMGSLDPQSAKPCW